MAQIIVAGVSRADARVIYWGVNESGMELRYDLKTATNYVAPDPTYYLDDSMMLIRPPCRSTDCCGCRAAHLTAGGCRDQGMVTEDCKSDAIAVINPMATGFIASR